MINDIVFYVIIAGVIAYSIFIRERNVGVSELSEVKRWHSRGYITPADISMSVDDKGNVSRKDYNKLKAKVDRQRTVKALTDEKPKEPKEPKLPTKT